MGRPSKFNPEKAREIVDLMRGGAGLTRAAELAGISRSTLHLWCKRGHCEPDSAYHDFALAVDAAAAEQLAACEKALLQVASSGSDWRATAWVLERRLPLEYGAPDRITDLLKSKMAEELIEEIRGKLEPELFTVILQVLAGEEVETEGLSALPAPS